LFEVSVKALNVDQLARQFSYLGKDLNKWIADGMTNTAEESTQAVRRAIPAHIDRPTPWTMSSLFFFPAEKEDLRAAVAFKWEFGRRSRNEIGMFDAPQSMQMQVYGGKRKLKDVEKKLQQAGVTPPGRPFLVPSRALKRDRYGNVTRKTMNKILYSGVSGGVMAEKPLNGGRNRGATRKGQSFVMRKKGKGAIGIFKNTGRYSYTKSDKPATPQFWFNAQPHYSPIFDFHGIANRGAAGLLNNVDNSIDRGVRRYLRS